MRHLLLLLLALVPAPLAAQALSAAERLAAARAAGYTVRGATILNECGAAVERFAVERRDLNGDGLPELIVTDEGGCYGAAGATFAVLRKAGGGWSSVLAAQGIPDVLDTRQGGWNDVRIGGPGFTRMPVAHWTGANYSY